MNLLYFYLFFSTRTKLPFTHETTRRIFIHSCEIRVAISQYNTEHNLIRRRTFYHTHILIYSQSTLINSVQTIILSLCENTPKYTQDKYQNRFKSRDSNVDGIKIVKFVNKKPPLWVIFISLVILWLNAREGEIDP